MPEIVRNPNYVTFINVFKCRPADQDEVVRINVEIVERVALGSPGFISASIPRSTDGTRVFNYLQWESSEHLTRMQASPEFRRLGQRFAGLIKFEPHRCEVAHVGEASSRDRS